MTSYILSQLWSVGWWYSGGRFYLIDSSICCHRNALEYKRQSIGMNYRKISPLLAPDLNSELVNFVASSGKTLYSYYLLGPRSLPVVVFQPDDRPAHKTRKDVLCVDMVWHAQRGWFTRMNAQSISNLYVLVVISNCKSYNQYLNCRRDASPHRDLAYPYGEFSVPSQIESVLDV